MKLKRMHIDLAFHRIQPEVVLHTLLTTPFQRMPGLSASSRKIPLETYLHYARPLACGLSDDELENRFRNMEAMTHTLHGGTSLFLLLPRYTEDVLRLSGTELVCRLEELLNWRELSLQTGQDLLTTAYLAWHDSRDMYTRLRFDWPAVLAVDDARLKEILRRGISENHFHLYGSTQSFSLSWMCLMNFPERIGHFLRSHQIAKKMFENLQDTPNLNPSDIHLPWERRLCLAAILRAYLFERCKQFQLAGSQMSDLPTNWGFSILGNFMRSFQPGRIAADQAGRLRFQYGIRCRQADGSRFCLDYAIPPDGMESVFRALSGERYLLYHCFVSCFQGRFSAEEQDLFYLYILLKAQFRSELIQGNRRVGFQNFANYQDRKFDFFETIPAYVNEAIRLSIGVALKDENIQSLEARLSPQKTAIDIVQSVLRVDSAAEFAREGVPVCRDTLLERTAKAPYFYTLHFIKKKPDTTSKFKGWGCQAPRNTNIRKNVRRCAKALSFALSQNELLCYRIRGIDAASHEIGCRPEVFAQAFRFLRKIIPKKRSGRFWANDTVLPKLGVTFHAGEDFLDLTDGLRAIDEAVRFLNLQRGDRLGHALALGIDPVQYYQLKEQQIVLSKQDYLDNLVWLLFRGNELGVTIPVNLRCQLQTKAEQLFYELYANNPSESISLLHYYQSWKLRGDAPEYFRTGTFRISACGVPHSYEAFGLAEGRELELLRKQQAVTKIYSYYHYGPREKGEETQAIQPGIQYIQLLNQMQERLQQKIVHLGIGIECNPSSNVLIGTFRRYEHHPIFRFNHYQLNMEDAAAPQLSVSINTDDQGVFDTSLENEYALIAACLRWHPDGSASKYSDDQIYDYLNHIRELGNLQTFAGVAPY